MCGIAVFPAVELLKTSNRTSFLTTLRISGILQLKLSQPTDLMLEESYY